MSFSCRLWSLESGRLEGTDAGGVVGKTEGLGVGVTYLAQVSEQGMKGLFGVTFADPGEADVESDAVGLSGDKVTMDSETDDFLTRFVADEPAGIAAVGFQESIEFPGLGDGLRDIGVHVGLVGRTGKTVLPKFLECGG